MIIDLEEHEYAAVIGGKWRRQLSPTICRNMCFVGGVMVGYVVVNSAVIDKIWIILAVGIYSFFTGALVANWLRKKF